MVTEEEENELRRERVEVLLDEIRTGKKGIDAKIALYLEETRLGVSFKETTKAVGTFAGGLTSSAKAVSGSTGNFNDLSAVVAGTIGAITGLLGKLPFFGKAIEAFGGVAIEVATFGMGQVQASFDSFQSLSRAGQIGADGIAGMAEQMRSTNMPLATYSKLLMENSENLAFLSSTALTGGKIFSKTMSDMAGKTGKPLRRLGLSVEEIGETVVNFQVMQRRQGMLNQLSQDQITQGTAAYAEELDLIARLTGKTREGIQKEREEALSDSRFRAATAEMDVDTRQKHMDALAQISDPALKRAYMDQLSGYTNSAASVQMEIIGMGDAIRKSIDDINDGTGTGTDAFNTLVLAMREATKPGGAFQTLSKVVESGTGPMGNYATAMDMASQEIRSEAEARKVLTKLKDSEGSKTDKVVDAMIDLQASTSALNYLFIGSDGAIDMISGFSKALRTTIEYVEDKVFSKPEKIKLNGQENQSMPTALERARVNYFGSDEDKAALEKRAAATKARNLEKYEARKAAQKEQRAGGGYQSPLSRGLKTLFAKEEGTSSVPLAIPKAGSIPDREQQAPLTTAKEVVTSKDIKKNKPKTLDEVYGKVSADDVVNAARKKADQQNKLQDFNKAAGSDGWTPEEKQIQTEMRESLQQMAFYLSDIRTVARRQLAAQEGIDKNTK